MVAVDGGVKAGLGVDMSPSCALGGLRPVWDHRVDSLEALLAARRGVTSVPHHVTVPPAADDVGTRHEEQS